MRIFCFGFIGLFYAVHARHVKIDFRGQTVDFWRKEKVHRENDGSIILTTSIKIPPPVNHTALNYVPADCTDIQKHNLQTPKTRPTSGVYMIYPAVGKGYKAYCDFTTDGGGWTIFQRRFDGSVGFYRTWKEYQNGFGSLKGEHWLGNQILHEMTSRRNYELRVELRDFDKHTRYAKYSSFNIGSNEDGYKLLLGSYSGTAGDSLSFSNGMKFSTHDKDLDKTSSNCASSNDVLGAWWFKDCFRAHLNGPYSYKPKTPKNWLGLIWNTWRGASYSLKETTMMIRKLS